MKSDPSDPVTTVEHRLADRSISLKPATRRLGADAWFPYYAGFSPQFVREVLLALGVRPGWTVLDSWNGSGTTTTVANALGCDAVGYDINPVAVLVACARLTRRRDAEHCSGLASELLSVASRHDLSVHRNDALLLWLSPRLTHRYRRLEHAILSLLASKAGVPIDPRSTPPPPFAAFFLLCLIRAAKSFARIKPTSNPTWISPSARGDARAQALDSAFLATIEASAADAVTESLTRASSRPTCSSVTLADARSLPLPNASIDAAVTSPPYCTRIDYFRATQFELAALGISPAGSLIRDLRGRAMGTTMMRSEEITTESLSADVRELLQKIQCHPSKDSKNYYYRHFAQYFTDAHRSLAELRRVLRPRSTAVLVVQSSYYKELPIPLGELYAAMGKSLGLTSRVILRVPVRRVLAQINQRAAQHTQDRQYTEDVVALQRVA
jgi:DNA modification methylase